MIVVDFYIGNWNKLYKEYFFGLTKQNDKYDLQFFLTSRICPPNKFFLTSRICPPIFQQAESNQTKWPMLSSNFFNKTKMFFLPFPSIFYFISHQYLLYQYLLFPLIHFTNIIEKTKRRVQCSTKRQERKKSSMNDQRMPTKI